MAEQTHEASADSRTESLSQTNPHRLTDYEGADHRGQLKVTIDESYLPDGIDDAVGEDLEWCLKAINSVIHYPNLACWIRTKRRDLVFTHEPQTDPSHERAGFLRAAVFDAPTTIPLGGEHRTGLVTPFDAFNTCYDVLVESASTSYEYEEDRSLLLTDIEVLPRAEVHALFQYENDHLRSWGRQQLARTSWPVLPSEQSPSGIPTYENGEVTSVDEMIQATMEHIDIRT